MVTDKRKKYSASDVVSIIIFSILSICCVVPILYILSASFTSEASLAQHGYSLIPSDWSLDAYEFVLKSPGQILNSYGISILVTIVGGGASLLFTAMLGYVMSRRDFSGSKIISFLVVFTLLFNAGMVPAYITITRYYHLKDTIFALILPYIIVPWHVMLMRGFLNDTPMSLIEAAKLVGSSEVGIFFKIIMPISKPALATVGLFGAFMYWNDWWLAMLYIDNQKLIPLQYYLYRIMNNIQFLASSLQAGNLGIDVSKLPNETARMALCVLAVAPMLFVFPFFQKHFVKGLTVGAVKG